MSETAAADEAPPRRRVVRDPVHDYVEIPGELEPLVASAALQRLRNLRKGRPGFQLAGPAASGRVVRQGGLVVSISVT